VTGICGCGHSGLIWIEEIKAWRCIRCILEHHRHRPESPPGSGRGGAGPDGAGIRAAGGTDQAPVPPGSLFPMAAGLGVVDLRASG
jgi:hypothetical protein